MPKVSVGGGPSNAAAEPAELPPPPPVSAPKAEHAAYAEQALGVPADEAQAKTKAELVELAKDAVELNLDGGQ